MQVYGRVSLTSSSATLQVDVPLGYVSFAWTTGNGAVNDVTFTIRDVENQVVYAYSGSALDLEEGIFLHTNNSCGNGADCGMPTDLYAEILDDQDVFLAWEPSSESEDYNVYRDGACRITGFKSDFSKSVPSPTARHWACVSRRNVPAGCTPV